ncbi:hypothetical protein D9758_006754 [Tetrapyrgos nigripes]|uniref:Uncharacterized protein n=1 Tax=Tetrapyrgos nigripes TaxID=182062 RepID=A0A8H5CY29_9AGAR|nr:hypothetical protein D9758_006754 [Tetrapyrgos nigripes]
MADRREKQWTLFSVDDTYIGTDKRNNAHLYQLLHSFSLPLSLFQFAYGGTVDHEGSTCTVHASDDASDDAPAILNTFDLCGQGGKVFLHDDLYHIESVMKMTGLKDVTIDLTGKLLWGTDIDYWGSHGFELGFQNQTTSWILSGDNITFNGHGIGTLDGQIWYDFTQGISNLHNLPITLVIANTTSSHFDGLRIASGRNTGVDIMFFDKITLRNWTIAEGDDSISVKANSTNILIQDCIVITHMMSSDSSLGQYKGEFEIVENVVAERAKVLGTRYAGLTIYTSLGGGGGIGYAKNITFKDFTLDGVFDMVA